MTSHHCCIVPVMMLTVACIHMLPQAGKALANRMAEIRVQFRHVPGNLYRNKLGIDLDRATNELVCDLKGRENQAKSKTY